MGFLDRMVADLIGNATGLPVRGLIRKVGAKRLLVGGAALAAGGLAVSKMREANASQTQSTPPTRPDLPPVPGQNAAPDLPPVPLPPVPGADEDGDFDADLNFAIVRTMIAAALADGHLAPEERTAIQQNIDGSGLSPEQTAVAHGDLMSPASPGDLAALATTDEARDVVYRAALLIAAADHDIGAAERTWLQNFADALGFDAERQGVLERDFGIT